MIYDMCQKLIGAKNIMELKPIPRLNVVETIVEQFTAMILQKEMTVGDRVPSEYELMEIFDVGRSSVREALKMLEAIGVIDRSPGRNTIIKPGEHLLSRPLSFFVALNDISMQGLFETRSVLEVANARFAAVRSTQEHRDEMLYWIKQGERENIDKEEKLIANYSFHYAIAKAAGNNVTLALFKSLKTILFASQGLTLNAERERDDEFYHVALYQCIENKDTEGAAKNMMEHLSHVYESHLAETLTEV